MEASRADKGRLWSGLAGLFYVLGLVAFVSPSNSPSTGWWAWLHNLSAKAFGSNGDIVLYAIVGTACLVAGLPYLRSRAGQLEQSAQILTTSPNSDFRPYLARFVLSAVFGGALGAVGAGFLMYFGVVVLLVLLGTIITTRDPKKRITAWGLLCGLALGCFGTWGLLGIRF